MIQITKDNVKWAVMNMTGRLLRKAARSLTTPYKGQWHFKAGPFNFAIDKSIPAAFGYTCRTSLLGMLKERTAEAPSPYGALYNAIIQARLDMIKMTEEQLSLLANELNIDPELSSYEETRKTDTATINAGISTVRRPSMDRPNGYSAPSASRADDPSLQEPPH